MTLHPQARQATTAAELAFVVVLGLAPHAADYLARLYAAGSGQAVPLLRVHASRIRAALDAESLDTIPGGYTLTEQGRAECAKAVEALKSFVVEAA